jgi:hypothetical protein
MIIMIAVAKTHRDVVGDEHRRELLDLRRVAKNESPPISNASA